ncbi:hypothetical protein ACFR9U_00800 [Halorientalis brevis]|uniref:Uncharacterized protein n=1 Tax=Halorientalis brevis TaxID=1126241 RepID=A0ABD6C638_9EURY|nr:hypothetical protein [Halorientalis brevis]
MTLKLSREHAQLAALLSLLAVLLIGVSLLSGTAAAQETTATPQNTTQPVGGERIHGDLLLVEKTYRDNGGQNGTLVLTFKADRPTAVTLIDAGAFMSGGELPTRTAVVDGRTTMTMPVTQVGSMVGITIVSDGVRYAVPYRTSESADSHLFTGKPTWQDTRIAGLSGFIGGLVIISFVAWYRVHSDRGSVERVL